MKNIKNTATNNNILVNKKDKKILNLKKEK